MTSIAISFRISVTFRLRHVPILLFVKVLPSRQKGVCQYTYYRLVPDLETDRLVVGKVVWSGEGIRERSE